MIGTTRHRRLPLQLALLLVALVATVAGVAADGRAETMHSPDVERWRPLVERYWNQYGYGDEVEYALMVMWGESWGVPTAQHPGSGATGLYQHMPIYWEERSAAAGWAGASIWDPEANIAVAAWLRATSAEHGWRHWEATHVSYPPGSFGPDTHWENGRYVAMGGGSISVGGHSTPARDDQPVRAIEITKTAAGPGAPPEVPVNTPVEWSIEVTNTGAVDLWNVVLWDDSLGEIPCPAGDSLPVGSQVTCPASEPAELGGHEFAVWAVAWDADGGVAEASATGSYLGVPPAALSLEARVNGYPTDDTGTFVVAGDPVTVSYHLTNDGEVDLYAPYVWDDASGEIACEPRSIRPGETVVCGTVITPGLGDGGHLAWVWVWTEVGNEIEASDRLAFRVIARDIGPALATG